MTSCCQVSHGPLAMTCGTIVSTMAHPRSGRSAGVDGAAEGQRERTGAVADPDDGGAGFVGAADPIELPFEPAVGARFAERVRPDEDRQWQGRGIGKGLTVSGNDGRVQVMGEKDIDERGGGAPTAGLDHEHRLTRHVRDGAPTHLETRARFGGIKENGGVRGHR